MFFQPARLAGQPTPETQPDELRLKGKARRAAKDQLSAAQVPRLALGIP